MIRRGGKGGEGEEKGDGLLIRA